jgi:hypothetical protein
VISRDQRRLTFSILLGLRVLAMSIINDAGTALLWADAQSKPEWATTKLWQYIFRTRVFSGDDWAISSQQPPTDAAGDLRRVGFIVEHVNEQSGNGTRILFIEAKAGTASSTSLEDVEYQTFKACGAYLHSVEKQRVYAMTCFGGNARLWIYERGHDSFTPFVPPRGHRSWSQGRIHQC